MSGVKMARSHCEPSLVGKEVSAQVAWYCFKSKIPSHHEVTMWVSNIIWEQRRGSKCPRQWQDCWIKYTASQGGGLEGKRLVGYVVRMKCPHLSLNSSRTAPLEGAMITCYSHLSILHQWQKTPVHTDNRTKRWHVGTRLVNRRATIVCQITNLLELFPSLGLVPNPFYQIETSQTHKDSFWLPASPSPTPFPLPLCGKGGGLYSYILCALLAVPAKSICSQTIVISG